MQKRLDFFEQILYDSQADLQIQPAQSKYDPLAQSVEHLTFNQGVRSSNLRWITSKFPLKSPIFGYFRGFFMPFFNEHFCAKFTLFYPTLR